MKIYRDFDLTHYNSYNLISRASLVYFPETIEDICYLNQLHAQDNLVYLGSGNNIIFTCSYFKDRIFAILRDNLSSIKVDGSNIYADAGACMKKLSIKALKNSLSGLEVFYDIPGTLGGGIYMNAGAYGEDIFNILKYVTALNKKTSKIEKLEGSALSMGYRKSPFQSDNYIILNACLELKKYSKRDILNKMRSILNKRDANFPKNLPNAGSVFVRPANGLTVGEMVQELGLKGARIGGAMISPKHGGFIVNVGNAVAQDILNLIRLMKEEINKHYGIELTLEQRLI